MNLLGKITAAPVKIFSEAEMDQFRAITETYLETADWFEDISTCYSMRMSAKKEGDADCTEQFLSTGIFASQKSEESVWNTVIRLHTKYISTILQLVENSHHVELETDWVARKILPNHGKVLSAQGEEFLAECDTIFGWRVKMEDILEYIYSRMNGKTFEQLRLDYLVATARASSWPYRTDKEAYFEQKGANIKFYASSYSPYCRGDSTSWSLTPDGSAVLYALAHNETGNTQKLPAEFEGMQFRHLPRRTPQPDWPVFTAEKVGNRWQTKFVKTEKLQAISFSKNGAITISFKTEELASLFVENYLNKPQALATA